MGNFNWGRNALIRAIALMLCAANVQAASDPVLSMYFVKPANDAAMDKIARQFEVKSRRADGFDVIVPASKAKKLLALAPSARLIEADLQDEFRRLDTHSPAWRAGYHTLVQVQAMMKDLATKHPDFVEYSTYGKSTQGNDLSTLRIHNKSFSALKPEIMLTAATHGNELITVEVLLNILNHIVDGYPMDVRIKNLVDGHDIYFIPVVNTDGFIAHNRYDNGRDPNRSYPYPNDTQGSPTGSIKPIMAFAQSHNFVGSIDFHSSGGLVMYPWGYTKNQVAGQDLNTFQDTAQMMAQESGYRAGQISRILYVAEGSSADYYYWQKKTRAFGVEMANTNVPPVSQIASIVNENQEMTLKFIEQF